MAATLWGKKIGMTQVFSKDKVVPVTAIDLAHWHVTSVKTQERDGYTAIQVGLLKNRYAQTAFNKEWLNEPKKYFYHLKEVTSQKDATPAVGDVIEFTQLINSGQLVDVVGKTTGRGFAGVVKRHDFNGPPGSHGSNMGKRPGSSSSYRSQGRIIKGKKFPGHMGTDTRAMRNLEVVSIDNDAKVVLVKGSVPGKVGSLLCIRKSLDNA